MSSFNNFPFFLLIFAVLVLEIVGERDFVVIADYVTCTHNQEFVKSSNCSVDKSFNPPRSYLDVHLQRDIQRAYFSINVILQHKKTVRSILNIKNQNACEYFEGTTGKPFLSIVRVMAKRFGEFPNRCPIKKDFHFLYTNITVDPEVLPVFTPEGSFTVKASVRTKKDFGFSYEWRGFVKRK